MSDLVGTQIFGFLTRRLTYHTFQIILGLVKFFVVVFGGLFIGVLLGLISSFLTKFTNSVKGSSFKNILSHNTKPDSNVKINDYLKLKQAVPLSCPKAR